MLYFLPYFVPFWPVLTSVKYSLSFFRFVSITLVFLNKSLLSGSTSVDAPLFITCFQCAITAAACYGILVLPPNFGADNLSCGQITISLQTLKKVLPLSIVFVAMITFNNLCLKYVGVSFYYIGRSLTTVFNVIFTYLILGQKTSIRAIFCCFIIILGFWLGVDQESSSGTFSTFGTFFGVLASVFVSLYAIYIKRVLPVVDGNVWLLTFYNNVNAMLLFIPLMVLFGEFPKIVAFEGLFSLTFWILMTMGGVFGCAIGYVTGLQVSFFLSYDLNNLSSQFFLQFSGLAGLGGCRLIGLSREAANQLTQLSMSIAHFLDF